MYIRTEHVRYIMVQRIFKPNYVLYVYCRYVQDLLSELIFLCTKLQIIGVPGESFKFRLMTSHATGGSVVWDQQNTISFALYFPELAVMKVTSGTGIANVSRSHAHLRPSPFSIFN